MNVLLAAFVICAGAGLAAQPLLNARVAGAAGHPVYGALVSLLGSAALMLTLAFVLRLNPPNLGAVGRLPVWTWLGGGAIGAVFVLAVLIVAPRLGAAVTISLAVTGQIAASLLLDQFGVLGVPQHPIELTRLLGAALLIAGVVLIRFG